MSQPQHVSIPPSVAADLPPWWLAQVRGIVVREGLALRSGFPAVTIEVQNINAPETWQPLNLQTNTPHFATEQDRDHILAILTGEKPLPV